VAARACCDRSYFLCGQSSDDRWNGPSFYLSCANERCATRPASMLAGHAMGDEDCLGLTRSEGARSTREGGLEPFVCRQSLLDRRLGDERDRAKFCWSSPGNIGVLRAGSKFVGSKPWIERVFVLGSLACWFDRQMRRPVRASKACCRRLRKLGWGAQRMTRNLALGQLAKRGRICCVPSASVCTWAGEGVCRRGVNPAATAAASCRPWPSEPSCPLIP
jgi:hypothetical protein